MGNSRRLKREGAVRPDLEGAVHQLVVVGGDEFLALPRQSAKRYPAWGWSDDDPVLEVPKGFRIVEQRRSIEVSMAAIEMAGPDGELVGVDPILEPNRLSGGGDLEALLVQSLERQGIAVLRKRGHLLEVAGELADQIAPRRPDGKGDDQRSVGRWKLRFHVEQVGMRALHRNAVADPPVRPERSRGSFGHGRR